MPLFHDFGETILLQSSKFRCWKFYIKYPEYSLFGGMELADFLK